MEKIENSKVVNINIGKIVNLPLFYTTIWNGMLQLRDSETSLFIKMLEKYIELSTKYDDVDDVYEKLFSSRIRKEIRETLGISEHVFNTRLMYLKKKGVILPKNNGYIIDARFIPSKEIVFKFNY